MNVDRTRFLLLTSALSAATAVAAVASGCTVNNTDKSTTPAVDSGIETDGASADAWVAPDAGDAEAAACLDDKGESPSCAAVDASCSTACQHYLPNFKKGVARSIISCLSGLPTCEGAGTAIANCVQLALAASCQDTTATDFCTPVVESCKPTDGGTSPLDITECVDLVTGLNSTGRASFTTCVTEGTPGYCGPTPSACIDSLE
jgi:hypothetical protein